MNKEIYLIIGHRGTGKTHWVKEVEKYFSTKKKKILIFDIDEEIQKTSKQDINQMFKKGEKFFRVIEKDVFEECLKKAQVFKGKVFISLGAGYAGGIPSFCKVIHLKRQSDQAGRVFFDRPRVLSSMSPFDEYHKLYSKRNLIYKQQRDFVFTRLDYFKSFEKWDEIFLNGGQLPFRSGILTLSEKNCPSSQDKLNFFIDQRLKWGLKYFELKDDEVSPTFLDKILFKIPPQQILLSFRKKNSVLFKNLLNRVKNLTVDWPLEWGERDDEEISRIYSLHDRGSKTLNQVLDQFPKKKNTHLKLAIEIFSFEELWQGHLWQREDPLHRSFHPRSIEGRWKWYRLLFGPHQPLYFIREDNEEGVLDQPVMAESINCGKGISKQGFACVLGDPIEHSATPCEQQSFFEKYKLLVIPVLMREEEVNHANIKILENFGMKFSAVTSPLKKQIYYVFSRNKNQKGLKIIRTKTSVSSLNTLILTKKGWSGFNTDRDGALAFKQFIHQSDFCKIAVWGGGAVRDVLDFVFSTRHSCEGRNPVTCHSCLSRHSCAGRKPVYPICHSCEGRKPVFKPIVEDSLFCENDGYLEKTPKPYEGLKNQSGQLNNKNDIAFYSAQTGKLLKGSEQSPELVIWAVGRSRMSLCSAPPQHWKPLYVLDLNYTEDSPGREYALKTKAQYLSGWLWFKTQAQAQRVLFEKLNMQSFKSHDDHRI